MLISSDRSHLVVVDVQERLMPAIHDANRAIRNVKILLAAAGRLGIPVTLTEQYPKGLGGTVAEVLEGAPAHARRLEKIHFSAAAEPAIADAMVGLRAEGRDQLVICGAEAHVCVLQTAIGFREAGYTVFLVADAVSSRSPHSVETAKARMLHAGCQLVTTEMAVFEWLERAGSPIFREVSPLIR